MMKNLGVAAALVLCAVTLRTGAIPSLTDATDAILTAATDQSLLDEKLGKLTFVSAMFPEAVLVFGENHGTELSAPVSDGEVIHTWSESEPYVSFRTEEREVYAAADGEINGVYHGNDGERLIRVDNENGTTCIYGNLDSVSVATGEWVEAGQTIGTVMTDKELVFEMRMNGISINPTSCFSR